MATKRGENRSRTHLSLGLFMLTIILVWVVTGCQEKPPTPMAVAQAPEITGPKVGAPTPLKPGEEVGISVDVSSVTGVTLTYTWKADRGQIVRGHGTPAITYRAPDEPGTYNIRVVVEWDSQSVDKATSIKVEEESTQTPTPLPPTDTPKPTDTPTNTPTWTPTPTDTPTNTPTPTDTPKPTDTPTNTPTWTPKPTDTPTNTPTPTCPPADAEGTIPPAVAIYSITFVVNGVGQVADDFQSPQVSSGDRVEVKEVTICVDPFEGNGGQVYVEFEPVEPDPTDPEGKIIANEVRSTRSVGVTSGFTPISGPAYTWTIGSNWQHFSVVTVHYPPGGGTQNPNCEGGLCEVDDRMIVPIQ